MKNYFRSFSEGGQALILIVLGAIGFFAVVGLAIDGSAKYSDRRHAQNAADAAALAGAFAKYENERLGAANTPITCPPSSGPPSTVCTAIQDAARARAGENGYTGDLVRSIVVVSRPPATGVYSNCSDYHFDCNDYVQVTITSFVDTWFAKIVGIYQTQNYVEAVASTISENHNFSFGGNAVIALRPDGCALTAIGGSQVVVNGGGLYSNSSDGTCAFHGGTCASLLDVNDSLGNQGNITMVGGYGYGSGCAPQANILAASAKQIPYPPPYQEIPEPAECSTAGGKTYTSSTTTLTPGYFDTIPGNGPTWKNTIILTPGVYCVGTSVGTNNTEILQVSGTFYSTPGVFIYVKPGGSFTFNGGSGIQLWGINDASVAADSSLAKYKGFLLYLAPNYASGTPAICKINGHSGDTFQGTIYAPYCNITMDGTSDPTGFQSQIIGYEVKFAGGANILLNYDAGSSAVFNIPWQVGLTK